MKAIFRLFAVLAIAALVVAPISFVKAADMPTKAAPAPARVDAPSTWAGPFVLGFVGVGQAKGNLSTDATSLDGTGTLCRYKGYGEVEGEYKCYRPKTFTTSTPLPAGYSQDNIIGVLFGAGVGYNWQQSQWVLGVEADAAGSFMRGYINQYPISVEHRIPFLGNATVRAMYLVAPNFGIYVKGGLALAQFKTDVAGLGSASSFKAGWTLGGGLEAKIPGTLLSARVEGNYAKFSDQTLALPGLVSTLKGDVITAKVALVRGF